MDTKTLIREDGMIWEYTEKTGLWQAVSESHLFNLISESIRNLARRNGEDAVPLIKAKVCQDIRAFIEDPAEKVFAGRQRDIVHVANGVLVFDKDAKSFKLQPFSPDFYSRNRCEIPYDPEAKCSRFLKDLLGHALPDEGDITLLKRYCGQCLLGDNPTQTFLLITGTAGGGKGTVVGIIEKVIGEDNAEELRTAHLHTRFETARFIGKTLLCGKDVSSDFLLQKSAGKIKALCGGDRITAEIKGSSECIELRGRFNIVVVSNANLKVSTDSDLEAWRRRIIWIKFNQPPAKNRIPDFDKVLLAEEGSGILNWMLEGAA